MATDAAGNLFIADADNHLIEKVTSAGVLSIVAGTGSYGAPTPGIATASKLSYPNGVGTDAAGNLFIADADGRVIERVTSTVFIANVPHSGIAGASFASTFATTGDGPTSVTSSTPGVCTASGSTVTYVAAGNCQLVAHVGQGTKYVGMNGVPQSLVIQGFAISPVSLPRATRGRNFGPVAFHATAIAPSTATKKVTVSWTPVTLPLGITLSPSGILSGVASTRLAPGVRAIKVRAIETIKTQVGGTTRVSTFTAQATFNLTIR